MNGNATPKKTRYVEQSHLLWYVIIYLFFFYYYYNYWSNFFNRIFKYWQCSTSLSGVKVTNINVEAGYYQESLWEIKTKNNLNITSANGRDTVFVTVGSQNTDGFIICNSG
jgi:hypothetical protein